MTNGEKMLNVFCDSKALELGGNVSFRDGDWAIMFPDEWWHTEYKEPTTKNDLGVEYISRSELMAILSDYYDTTVEYRSMLKEIAALPSVTPQEPQTFKWCTNCREYDQEKHCCHRWSKVIRDTVEEMKQEQETVLDKIRAEIKQLVSRYTISRERGSMGQVEWEDRLIREVDILQIIDKYKAESERVEDGNDD